MFSANSTDCLFQFDDGSCGDVGTIIMIVLTVLLILSFAICLVMALVDISGCIPKHKEANISTTMLKYGLYRGGSIDGGGSFGTVYRGYWTPHDGVVSVGRFVKIPVAIKYVDKKLSEDKRRSLKLDEIFNLNNEHILKPLLACCEGRQFMWVNPLMHLGNLLNFVQKNKENVAPQNLLDWCSQIAQGMAYLEELNIVHGDLAAKNVMVKSPSNIKIVYDGLAKVHDIKEFNEKRLAPECLKVLNLTSKSDVWAFGVTVWELLTFGEELYEDICPRRKSQYGHEVLQWSQLDLQRELKDGNRLPQPSIATTEMYYHLLKCWMYDPEHRPMFKDLVEVFSNMTQFPNLYLTMPEEKSKQLPRYVPEVEKILPFLLESNVGGSEEVMTPDEYLEMTELSSFTTNIYWVNGSPINKHLGIDN